MGRLLFIDERFVCKAFKALIRETSVYKYYVELKENVFSKQGFLDLIKVPYLRISGAKQFLKTLRRKTGLSQQELAKFLNVSRCHVKNWENYRDIPLEFLIGIAEIGKISKDEIYSLIDKGIFKTRLDLPVRFEKIRDIVRHLSPQKAGVNWQITLFNYSDKILSKIKSTFRVNPICLLYRMIINSKELYLYLKTFFKYTKVSKIFPPLTYETKDWYDKNIDLKRAIIIPFLQSDGSICQKTNYIRFHGKNKILHDYFVDAMYFEYNELPSSYLNRTETCFVTEYIEKEKIVKEIMDLAGNTKTSPAKRGQKVEEYLQEQQPHLNYLINASKTEQMIALRIWASTEGSIGIQRNNYGRNVYPRLNIACSHPHIVSQLKKIAQRFRMNFVIKSKKDIWSGIEGLYTSALSSCIEFLKLGGFIKGVKISASSPYHEGIDKDILLLGIFEFKKREKKRDKSISRLSKDVHHEINKIIEKREYKTEDFYIKYFYKKI
jgi:transcriptional regulator with XRE-family HTH domain